jgi:hypothetical protein
VAARATEWRSETATARVMPMPTAKGTAMVMQTAMANVEAC